MNESAESEIGVCNVPSILRQVVNNDNAKCRPSHNRRHGGVCLFYPTNVFIKLMSGFRRGGKRRPQACQDSEQTTQHRGHVYMKDSSNCGNPRRADCCQPLASRHPTCGLNLNVPSDAHAYQLYCVISRPPKDTLPRLILLSPAGSTRILPSNQRTS